MTTLNRLISYRNKHPQLGLPHSEKEFADRQIVTYEYLMESGYIDQLRTKSDISVILRTGGTSSLGYKLLPSSHTRFMRNDRQVSYGLIRDVLRHFGLGFAVKLLTRKVVFLPGNMFEDGDVPVRYVSNTLVSEGGWGERLICPVPQKVFDGIGYPDVITKLQAIVSYFGGDGPVMISGVPTVVLQFAEVWKQVHGSYPKPSILVVGGCAIAPYMTQLHDVFGQDVVIVGYYNATEGSLGYTPRQLWSSEPDILELAIDCGVWYEFIDQTTNDFVSMDNLKADSLYRLVVSTYDGLCRYEIGDVIQFVDVERRWFKIVGRTSEYCDVANEHMQVQHIHKTMKELSQQSDYQFIRYSVYPEQVDGLWSYVLVGEAQDERLKTKGGEEDAGLAQQFDEILQQQNHNYGAKRIGGTLGSARVVVVEQGWFDCLIDQLNTQRGSTQSKLLTLYAKEENPVYKKLIDR